ncbi:MAG: hypothetical protein HRT38_20225 [Alteromonadaceae bacterium]|nr:hypothetical protein [Alteromonadaceae bacterium]
MITKNKTETKISLFVQPLFPLPCLLIRCLFAFASHAAIESTKSSPSEMSAVDKHGLLAISNKQLVNEQLLNEHQQTVNGDGSVDYQQNENSAIFKPNTSNLGTPTDNALAEQGVFYVKKHYSGQPIPSFSQNKHKLPKPIFDDKPEYIDFYYRAWQIGFNLLGFNSPQLAAFWVKL